jgi:hypothetical protein
MYGTLRGVQTDPQDIDESAINGTIPPDGDKFFALDMMNNATGQYEPYKVCI